MNCVVVVAMGILRLWST